MNLLVGRELRDLLVPRPLSSHKGDFGHIVIVAGSTGKAGAAILAARSAVRCGAGLVTAAVPHTIVQTVDAGSIESMTLALPCSQDGGLKPPAAAVVHEFLNGKTALAIGPGLGLDPATVETVHTLIKETDLPLVLDADGLNAVGTHLELLRDRKGDTILTPHPGELGRLLGVPTAEVLRDRLEAVRSCAERSGSIVVLKGHRSLIGSREHGVFVNPTGNPAMATGGSGDVLTGMIVALLGQGFSAIEATKIGVFIHGFAGDLRAPEEFSMGLTARDLIDAIPQAFERLGR